MTKISLRSAIFFLLFFGAMGAALTLHYGGDLMRDLAIRGQAMEVHPTARVLSADCTRYYLLMSACKIDYDNRAAGQPRANIQEIQSTRFLVFGSMTGERVMMLHPRSRPDIVTTSSNIENVGNRVLALGVLLGALLLASIGIVMRYARENGVPNAAESEAGSGGARSMDEAMTRHIQAQVTRSPTVTGGHARAGTFGRRGS
jgi:hypothetical protein